MRVEGQGEGRERCLAARCTYRSRPCSSAAMLLLYSFSSRSSYSETARDSHVKDHKSLVHGAYTHTHTHTAVRGRSPTVF